MSSPTIHTIDSLDSSKPDTSKMRAHKGNIPTLPQTKSCTYCSAKFTRTTHLNRHIRSHTNERLHRCNTCPAEFTRSDLLTRHKRTCDDSPSVGRCRRKSCQSCAESKVKCDLQQPCTKCASRGRACVYINNPEVSRMKKYGTSSSKDNAASSLEDQTPSLVATIPYPLHTRSGSFSSSSSSSPPTTPQTIYPVDLTSRPSIPPLDLSCVGDSGSQFIMTPSSSSLSPSPGFDYLDDAYGSSNVYNNEYNDVTIDSNLNQMLSDYMFEQYLEQSFSSTQSEFQSKDGYSNNIPLVSADTDSNALELNTIRIDEHPTPPMSYTTESHNSIMLTRPVDPNDASTHVPSPSQLTDNDAQHYFYLFLTVFSSHFPIIHARLSREATSPFLTQTMLACGALFAKTPTSQRFISDTIVATRDVLLQDLARNSSDIIEQNYLLLVLVLLQTVDLFQQRENSQVSPNLLSHHRLLVVVVRQMRLISRLGAWNAPDLSNINAPSAIDSIWQSWTWYETMKRVLLFAYIHDCSYCIYFGISPSFHPNELVICLPCDAELFQAPNATEWASVSMQQALVSLGEMRPSTVLIPMNPFSHFILIHTILCNLFTDQHDGSAPPSDFSHSSLASGTDPPSSFNPRALATQYTLHNWLQMWLSGSEATLGEHRYEDPPFSSNPLPFYWLAQISLLKLQEGTLSALGPEQFNLVTRWLHRIRAFLKDGNQIPTNLWEELMSIQVQLETGHIDDCSQYGLLPFLGDF